MGVLSKPLQISFQLIGSYLSQLYLNPIRTKSISACVVALLGNYTAQKLAGATRIKPDPLLAYGLFALLFGGTIPHFFYTFLTQIVNEESKSGPVLQLIIERFIYMPLFQLFSLYTLSRMEGKSHDETMKQISKIYYPVLKANFKYLTVLQYINMKFVPPMLRVLVANMIGFFWVIVIAQKRASLDSTKKKAQ